MRPRRLCGLIGAIYFLLSLDRLPATAYVTGPSALARVAPLSTLPIAWGAEGGYLAIVGEDDAGSHRAASFAAFADATFLGLNTTATRLAPFLPRQLVVPPFAAVRRLFNSTAAFRAQLADEQSSLGQVKFFMWRTRTPGG